MTAPFPTIAFVIPTKDRPQELRTMLASLAAQDVAPAQVFVVDASDPPLVGIEAEFEVLPLEYVRHEGSPSAAAQRNAGADLVRVDVDLVCFFDDDQVLLEGALRAMLAFFREADERVAGAGFNLVNEVDRRPSFFKRSFLADKLGIYSRRRGAVARSGWHALPGVVTEDLEVEWLTTGAVVWRRAVLEARRFDEFFDGYSYLEDLDFSYAVSRERKILLVAGARVHHFPSRRGRIGWAQFGKVEVRNRLYFVRKFGLSVWRCCVALGIRFLMSLGHGLVMPWKGGLSRAWGNLVGLFRHAGAGRVGA